MTERQGSRTHGPDGDFIRTTEQAEADAEAARLRSRSLSYREIARRLSVSPATAHAMVARALAEIVREPADDVLALELAKLDNLEQAALSVLEARHYTVSNGRLIYVGDEPLDDDGPVLAAIDRLLKIQDRRARYLGLDAPVKTEVRTVDNLDDEIRRLMDRMADGQQTRTPAPTTGADAPHSG